MQKMCTSVSAFKHFQLFFIFLRATSQTLPYNFECFFLNEWKKIMKNFDRGCSLVFLWKNEIYVDIHIVEHRNWSCLSLCTNSPIVSNKKTGLNKCFIIYSIYWEKVKLSWEEVCNLIIGIKSSEPQHAIQSKTWLL